MTTNNRINTAAVRDLNSSVEQKYKVKNYTKKVWTDWLLVNCALLCLYLLVRAWQVDREFHNGYNSSSDTTFDFCQHSVAVSFFYMPNRLYRTRYLFLYLLYRLERIKVICYIFHIFYFFKKSFWGNSLTNYNISRGLGYVHRELLFYHHACRELCREADIRFFHLVQRGEDVAPNKRECKTQKEREYIRRRRIYR